MKLICSDFDGTLCRGDISQTDRAAIEKFRAEGNLFGIVTGRGFKSIMHAIEHYNFKADFLVANSGALICGRDGSVERDFSVTGEILPDFCRYLNEDWSCPYLVVDMFKDELSRNEPGYDKLPLFHQVSVGQPTVELASELIGDMSEKWGEYVCGHQNGRCIDITSAGVSKSTGVGHLMELYGVLYEDIFTVGDEMNDYPMIRDYQGYAMQSGVDGLKAAATGVVPDMASLVEIALG